MSVCVMCLHLCVHVYVCVCICICVGSCVEFSQWYGHVQCTYLSTQLEVRHGYCDFSTSNDKDHKNKVEKTKEVVELILPNSLRESETERQRESEEHREKDREKEEEML